MNKTHIYLAVSGNVWEGFDIICAKTTLSRAKLACNEEVKTRSQPYDAGWIKRSTTEWRRYWSDQDYVGVMKVRVYD